MSPGKSRYNKKEAEAELKEQGMDICFDKTSDAGSSSSSGQSSFDECEGSQATDEVQTENHFLVCESSQIMKLIHDINATSKCATPGCNGKQCDILFSITC